MKKIITIFFVCVATFAAHNLKSQNYLINTCCPVGGPLFLNPNTIGDSSRRDINIDHTQPQNIWQVGRVTKTVFTTGYSGARAIVTDTINPYPPNNTSSFTLKILNCNHMWCGGGGYAAYNVQFEHKYNTEAGVDGGTIEVSGDGGTTWKNIIHSPIDTAAGSLTGFYTAANTVSSLGQPGFSGNSTSWTTCSFWIQPYPYDTVLVRFTFASNATNSGDGWMIGQINFNPMGEGIQQYTNFNLINVAPNPANNELKVASTSDKPLQGEIYLFDNLGRQVYCDKKFSTNTIDISSLKPGIYMVKYIEGNNYSTVKFIKQ
jgi:hypothetical protein